MFIDGRDDEMIVSGGEKSSPARSRNRSPRRDELRVVAIVGIEDEEFGQA